MYATSGNQPHYKRALRIIGRYLNQCRARVITVGDVDGGYLAHFAADEHDLFDLERIFRTRRDIDVDDMNLLRG